MAANRQPGSLGTSPQHARPIGAPVRGTPFVPGALNVAARWGAGTRTVAGGGWVEFKFADPADARGRTIETGAVVRLARGAESDSGYQRIELKTPVAAKLAAGQLTTNSALATQLRDLSGIAGEKLVDWTAQQLLAGELKVLWRPRTPLVLSVEPPPEPAPRARPAAPPPPPPSPAYSTFPPDLDAAAVAQSLVDAARDGVPFCEECMKAAAAESAHEESVQ